MVDLSNDELYHFGVKGMKWGVRRAKMKEQRARRAELKKPNPNYDKWQRFADRQVYGKRGERRINKRMNKGQSHLRAQATEAGQQVAKGYLAYKAVQFITSPKGQRIAGMAMSKAFNLLRNRHGQETVGNALKEIGNKVIIDTTVAE